MINVYFAHDYRNISYSDRVEWTWVDPITLEKRSYWGSFSEVTHLIHLEHPTHFVQVTNRKQS